MGLRAWIDSFGSEADLAYRSAEPVSPVVQAIAGLLAERESSFSMAEALQLPAVVRGLDILTSIAASYMPLAYRGGSAMDRQPRIVLKPDPFRTRYEHVSQTVYGLVTEGCAYWRLADHDPESGLPRQAIVLPHSEVNVSWERQPYLPRYDWRGTRLFPGRDLLHITIGRRPGELHGRGPLREGLKHLAAVAAAEEYARDHFLTGGIPPVVIRALAQVPPTAEEARKVKQAWMASRGRAAEPAVIGKDYELSFPGANPQQSQLQESRAFGRTVVAVLLGIPAPLLQVETSGATIVYQNASSAIEELTKVTVAPRYLAPVEQAWSDLVPSTQVVRFDLAEMTRADIAARFAIYGTAIDKKILTPQEARAFEGWSATDTEAAHAFDPSEPILEAVAA